MANLYSKLFDHDLNRACLSDDERTLSYGGLDRLARSMGQSVLESGVSPGDRLVAQTEKSVEAYALWLGCLAAGVIFVPANTAYTPAELAYFCGDSRASLLVVDDPAAGATSATDSTDAASGERPEIGCPVASLKSLAPRQVDHDLGLVEIADVDDQTPCALVYTSGTTGRPKGATLSHGCLSENAQALAEVWEFQPDDVLLHALPIFHVHGLFISLHPTLLTGARVRFLNKFSVAAVLDELPQSTVFMGVPTYYHRLLADSRFGPQTCENARLFTSGSAPMTELVHDEFTERTSRQIVERYGMSEAGIITSNRIDDVVAGSVGHPLPGYEVRIVHDDQSLAELAQTGSVEVRGPSLCLGYWGRPDADATSRSQDGWFRTGDVGHLDATGRLTLEGRSSDMIISGGLNVYPKEIEIALDAIAGVVESAVIGRPHPDLGEAVTAYLVMEPGHSIDSITETGAIARALEPLARFKHPKTIHAIAELPRNAMGKVQKVALRQTET